MRGGSAILESAHRYSGLATAARRDPPLLAVILGSGLGDVGRCLVREHTVHFADVPGLESPSVAGHRGYVSLGSWAGKRILVFEGRLHYYEGHSWEAVVQPVRIAQELGARILVACNASGGVRPELSPPALMAIRAHIDWTGRPKEILSLGQIHDIPYSLRLGELLQQAAGKIGYPLAMGVYAQVTGPCYETPAEIQALAKLGADAVGMSTAVEMETGCRLGLECAAISCVTNHAAGVAAGPIQHSEVLASAKMLESPVGNLLEAFLDLL